MKRRKRRKDENNYAFTHGNKSKLKFNNKGHICIILMYRYFINENITYVLILLVLFLNTNS